MLKFEIKELFMKVNKDERLVAHKLAGNYSTQTINNSEILSLINKEKK